MTDDAPVVRSEPLPATLPAAALACPTPTVAALLATSRRSADLVSATKAVSMALGEVDSDPPVAVLDAFASALRSGYTRYTDFSGDPELRAALAAKVSADTGREYVPTDVLVTHGATGGLAAAIAALVGPGDRVVMPDPTFSLYDDLVTLAGGVAVPVPTTADHHLDLAALAEALRGARAFVFCNPCNPTGAVYGRAELTALADLLAGTSTVVIADEAYSGLVYDGPFTSALDIAGLADRTVYCQTYSKTYAMTGLRLGYVVAPPALLRPIAAVHRTFNGSMSSALQRAGIAALQEPESTLELMRPVFERRRRVVVDGLSAIPQLEVTMPEGAFYVFPRLRIDLPSAEVTALALQHGVKVRAGSEFGAAGEGYLRVSYAAGEDRLAQGIERIAKALSTVG